MSAELRAWADKLIAFQTSNDIRVFLAAEGAKGFRNTTTACVLANFLSVKGNVGTVDVTAGRITFHEKFINFAGVEETRFGFIKPSTAMRLFIARFDRGDYPDLTLHT